MTTARRRIYGLAGSGAVAYWARLILAGRFPSFNKEKLVAIIGPNPDELENIRDAYAAFEPLFVRDAAPPALWTSADDSSAASALERIRQGAKLVLTSPQALSHRVPARDKFEQDSLELKAGLRIGRSTLLEKLALAGYQRVDFVAGPGEFAARGAVLDFYGVEPERALRLLFDEDEIVSIRALDVQLQTSGDFIDSARISSMEAGEIPFSDWLQDAVWLVKTGTEPLEVPAGVRAFEAAEGPAGSGEAIDFGARANGPYRGGGFASAVSEMERFSREGHKTFFFSLNAAEEHRVHELLEGKTSVGTPQFMIGPLRQGFHNPGLGLAVLSSSEVFSRRYLPSRWGYFKGSARSALLRSELKPGDYVVHRDYGIARCRGLGPIEMPGHGATDCLMLEYRGGDVLYIPMTEFGALEKYSGDSGRHPRLSSLDSRQWEKIKSTVREGARELAEQLLKTQALRQQRPGHAFPAESAMEREFAESFPFEETPDQRQAIEDTLQDMTNPHPMDRLVVGDVGFGKTEVAMRAVFKCVMGAKQAAVLAPTTILADQHFRNFSARFADYPVRVGLLTRFQTRKEVDATLKALAKGSLDVLIGTIRLLQKDVSYKDLGLVVIDEEHRFGVKDKERLKSLRVSVDCLALSATPIPRTLNQALSGLRGLSLITSAPLGRRPISTKIGPYNEGVIQAAILEEIARGGQVYYVHNRVKTLDDCLKRLQALLPTVRFGVVHGQMRAAQLETAMWDFFHKRFDVLLASTIIESGLDVPAVNTMLVENAHEFGLAQLYQLRGRIGRESQQAYCYLFLPEEDAAQHLSGEAKSRIDALRQFTQLGTGLNLALRDLEIRGAGEILGARQHGFVKAVGVDFYSQLLKEELEKLKGRGEAPSAPVVKLDVGARAFIPESYLPQPAERLDFYKRILRAGLKDAPALQAELADLCGPPPEPVKNLFRLLSLRSAAAILGVSAVVQKGERVEIWFQKSAEIGSDQLSAWTKTYGPRLAFLKSEDGDGLSIALEGSPILDWLERFFAAPKK